jgi:hypothetical protein
MEFIDRHVIHGEKKEYNERIKIGKKKRVKEYDTRIS